MSTPRRISGPLAALGSAAIILGLLAQPTPIGAASPPEPTLSAWGTARIDGVMGAGEWDRAAQIHFNLAIPTHDGLSSVPATLDVMNDAANLYVAVKAPGSYLVFNTGFEFDNDNDGRWPEQGDDVIASNTYQAQPAGSMLMFRDAFRVDCPGTSGAQPPLACGLLDTDTREGYPPPGTIDGAAAGFSNATLESSFIEMWHPLDSNDNAHDFSLRPASVVGFHLLMHVHVAGAGNGSTCGYPVCDATMAIPAEGLAHIRVATPTPTPTPSPTPTPAPTPTPSSSGSWAATITGAGLSGRASLTVPATDWATADFCLYHLKKGVSVAARIVAGAACDATATAIKTLPGYTTTVGGTWRQEWVFDGAGLVRLRSAIRSGTPLWFDVKVGGSRACTRLVEGDEITGKGTRGSVAFAFHVALPQSGPVVGRFDSSLMSNIGVQIRGAVDCGWAKGKIGVLGGLMDGADPTSPDGYFTVMVSDGPDGIIIGTGRPQCGTDGFGDPRTLAISSGEIVVIDR